MEYATKSFVGGIAALLNFRKYLGIGNVKDNEFTEIATHWANRIVTTYNLNLAVVKRYFQIII